MAGPLPLLTELRAARLARGLRLQDVAASAGLSRTRASELERNPSLARRGEVERLIDAVQRLGDTPQLAEDGNAEHALRLMRNIGRLLGDVIDSGEIDADELAEMLSVEPAAVHVLIETARLREMSADSGITPRDLREAAAMKGGSKP